MSAIILSTVSRIELLSASAWSASPCIFLTRLAGTLPGRKPGMRMRGAIFFTSRSIRASISLAAMVSV